MCWIGDYKNLKKTEKDIPVFKILYYSEIPITLLSVYQDFPYVLNKKIISEIEVESWINTTICRISKAIHSYSPELINIKSSPNRNSYIYYQEEECLDAFPTYGSYVRVNGIIPKGSTYALNDRGEYISDSIILKEIVPLYVLDK